MVRQLPCKSTQYCICELPTIASMRPVAACKHLRLSVCLLGPRHEAFCSRYSLSHRLPQVLRIGGPHLAEQSSRGHNRFRSGIESLESQIVAVLRLSRIHSHTSCLMLPQQPVCSPPPKVLRHYPRNTPSAHHRYFSQQFRHTPPRL